jgi:hypothetical protein
MSVNALDEIAATVRACIGAGVPLVQLSTAQVDLLHSLPADAKTKVQFCKQAGIKIPYSSELLPCGECPNCTSGNSTICEIGPERIYAIATLVGAVTGRRATRISTAALAAHAGSPWELVHRGRYVTLTDFANRNYNLSDPATQEHEHQVARAECTVPLIVADCTDDAGQWYWVLDGCHRTCAALRMGLPTLPAYVLTDAEIGACELSCITWLDFLQSLCDPRAAWTHV